MNRRDLQKKIGFITGELLREKGYIAFIDVFMKLGYLSQKDYDAWRMKRVPFLERVIMVLFVDAGERDGEGEVCVFAKCGTRRCALRSVSHRLACEGSRA